MFGFFDGDDNGGAALTQFFQYSTATVVPAGMALAYSFWTQQQQPRVTIHAEEVARVCDTDFSVEVTNGDIFFTDFTSFEDLTSEEIAAVRYEIRTFMSEYPVENYSDFLVRLAVARYAEAVERGLKNNPHAWNEKNDDILEFIDFQQLNIMQARHDAILATAKFSDLALSSAEKSRHVYDFLDMLSSSLEDEGRPGIFNTWFDILLANGHPFSLPVTEVDFSEIIQEALSFIPKIKPEQQQLYDLSSAMRDIERRLEKNDPIARRLIDLYRSDAVRFDSEIFVFRILFEESEATIRKYFPRLLDDLESATSRYEIQNNFNVIWRSDVCDLLNKKGIEFSSYAHFLNVVPE